MAARSLAGCGRSIQRTYVLFTVGLHGEPSLAAWLAAAGLEFLQKPFSPQALAQKGAECFDAVEV